MEQKPGGGLTMTETMQQPTDYGMYYREKKAERDRIQREKEASDRKFFAELRAKQERERPKIKMEEEKVWEALSWRAKEMPLSDSRWEKIRRRATLPSFGPEMTTARAEAEAEAVAPVDQGILGLGILNSIINRLTQLTEQSAKERERLRKLNRPSIF